VKIVWSVLATTVFVYHSKVSRCKINTFIQQGRIKLTFRRI